MGKSSHEYIKQLKKFVRRTKLPEEQIWDQERHQQQTELIRIFGLTRRKLLHQELI